MTELITFNEFIAQLAGSELKNYYKYHNKEMSKDKMAEYFEGNYEIHLHYLIETWKNYINDFVDDFKIDYNRQGTFMQFSDYFIKSLQCPMFQHRWLDDIFVHYILDNAVCLK